MEPAASGWTRIAIRDETIHDDDLPRDEQYPGFGKPIVDSSLSVLPYFIGVWMMMMMSVTLSHNI